MSANPDCLFLRACRREPVDRPPVWMMRQAGRYLPEYREVRKTASFLDLCRDADLAKEVTLQPIRRYGFDAAIIFSDILLPLIGMGAPFEFPEGGPRLPEPMDNADALRRLKLVDAVEDLPWVHRALSATRAELDPSVALLGFAGAPFTLFCYLVEGQGSRHFPRVKQLLYREPKLAEEILGLLAEQVGAYLVAQLNHGADAVQLFDTWAGLLSPDDYERFALPYARQVFNAVTTTGAPNIYYVNNGATVLEAQAAAGSTVVGVDWRMRMAEVRRRVPADVALQGNLDPLILLGEPDFVKVRVEAMLQEMEGRPGYIVNLGHGVIPQTPLDSVQSLVETVRAWKPAARGADAG